MLVLTLEGIYTYLEVLTNLFVSSLLDFQPSNHVLQPGAGPWTFSGCTGIQMEKPNGCYCGALSLRNKAPVACIRLSTL